MPRNVPGDRPHKPGGQARVLLRGKHVYLGKHGSPESHEAYARAVAEHLSGPEPLAVPDPGTPAAVALGASGGVAIPNRPRVGERPAGGLPRLCGGVTTRPTASRRRSCGT